MSTLQNIVSRAQKERQTSQATTESEKPQVRVTSPHDRVEWLSQIFPKETKESLVLFAIQYDSESEMQNRALQLARDKKKIQEEVKEWNLVESKNQSLRSKKIPEVPEVPEVPEPKPEIRSTRSLPQPQTAPKPHRDFAPKPFYQKKFEKPQFRPKPVQNGVKKWVKKVIPQAFSVPSITPQNIEMKTEEIQEKSELPIISPIETVEIVEKVEISEEKTVEDVIETPVSSEKPTLITPEDESFKAAEAQAHKMTLDLVDHSDVSSDPIAHCVDSEAQTMLLEAVSIGCQTEEELIWSSGIPCLLVPMAGMPGLASQFGAIAERWKSGTRS